MAMTAQVQNIISRTAKYYREGVSLGNATDIEIIDALWNGTTRLTDSVTQNDIDSVTSFASVGLTKAHVDGAIYAIKTARAALLADINIAAVMSSL